MDIISNDLTIKAALTETDKDTLATLNLEMLVLTKERDALDAERMEFNNANFTAQCEKTQQIEAKQAEIDALLQEDAK